jgi:hypothetical protein
MIARFDHRPMLTAMLALSTTVLVVVVITLSALLYTSVPAASPASDSGGGKPGADAAPKVMDAGSYGEVYGWNIQGGSSDISNDSAIDRHAEVVAAFHNAE